MKNYEVMYSCTCNVYEPNKNSVLQKEMKIQLSHYCHNKQAIMDLYSLVSASLPASENLFPSIIVQHCSFHCI